jgi:peptide-methionine (R)-S-oxide reductase
MVKINLSDQQWRKLLTPAQYAVLREKGTEMPYSGDLLYNEEEGDYRCAGCKSKLFLSAHKFEAGDGWPAFYDVANPNAVKLQEVRGKQGRRVEVLCANCGGHLGHVFGDAPDQPTGLRFSINSVALTFAPEAATWKS